MRHSEDSKDIYQKFYMAIERREPHGLLMKGWSRDEVAAYYNVTESAVRREVRLTKREREAIDNLSVKDMSDPEFARRLALSMSWGGK